MNNRLVEPIKNGLRDASVVFITMVVSAALLFSYFRLSEPTITSVDAPCAQYDMSRGERIAAVWDHHMMEYPEKIKPEVLSLLKETTKARGLEFDLRELAVSIGNELKNQAKYKDAIDVFQCLIETQKQLGAKDISLVETYNDLAEAYISAKDYVKAEQTLQTALTITEEFSKESKYEVALCLDKLADLQKIQKNYQKELELRERAHNIRVIEYGAGSQFLVESYYNLADLAARLGQKHKAINLCIEGLKIADHHPSGSEARQLRDKIRSLCDEHTKNPETPKK